MTALLCVLHQAVEILTNKQRRVDGAESLRFIRDAVSPFYVCTLTAGSLTAA